MAKKVQPNTITLDEDTWAKMTAFGAHTNVTPKQLLDSALNSYFGLLKLIHENKELCVIETINGRTQYVPFMTYLERELKK